MARYRKLDLRTWNDEKFRELTPMPCSGQSVWLVLVLGPQTTNIPGLFEASEISIADRFGWSLEDFREAFLEASSRGMAKADWKARLVWLPKAPEYNKPESPNVVRNWGAVFDELPECELKWQAYQSLKAFAEGLGEGFKKAFHEAFKEGCPRPRPPTHGNQEQEQEQEQKQKQKQEQKQEQKEAARRSVENLSKTGSVTASTSATSTDSTDESNERKSLDSGSSGHPPAVAAKTSTSERSETISELQAQMRACGAMAKALREVGVKAQSSHPTVMGWVQEHYTIERVLEAVAAARMTPGKETGLLHPNYIDPILREKGKPAAGLNGSHSAAPSKPQETAAQREWRIIAERGKQAGFREPRKDEKYPDYERALKQHERGSDSRASRDLGLSNLLQEMPKS